MPINTQQFVFRRHVLLLLMALHFVVPCVTAAQPEQSQLPHKQLVWLYQQIQLTLPQNTSLTQRSHRYHIRIDQSLSSAVVNICFSGKPPELLAVDDKSAVKYLTGFPKVSGGNVEFQGRYWRTGSLKENSCLRYESDISHYKQKKFNKRQTTPLLFIGDNQWLWLPTKLSGEERLLFEFELPEGYAISAPWFRLGDSQRQFVATPWPHDWSHGILLGKFEQQTVRLSDGNLLNVSLLPGLQKKQQLLAWVKHHAESLARYIGQFPTPQLQVLLIQSRRFKGGPVPWGEVNRGGGPAIYFVVNSQLDEKAFYQDWTASHEFAHLLMPKLDDEARWLSEGLASYLQYILMARAGQISEAEAWRKLVAGFNRGISGSKKLGQETLQQTVANWRSNYRRDRTMRLYWSGAAYFFEMDLALRRKTDGRIALADILRRFIQCCYWQPKRWTGEEITTRFDQIFGKPIFYPRYQQYIKATEFPAVEMPLKWLGIDASSGEIVAKEAPGYPLRNALILSDSAPPKAVSLHTDKSQ